MLTKKNLLFFVFFYSFALNAQVTIGGGLNSVAAFGIKNPYLGLNFQGEYREDDLAYFAKFYTTLPQNDAKFQISMDPINSNDSLSLSLPATLKYRYNVLELGKRYYWGKDLDFGPSAYGSSHFLLMMNSAKLSDDITFDKSRYQYPSGYVNKGKVFAVGIGLNAGVQYAFYYGTYFADLGFNYIFTALPNNEVASLVTTFKQVFFVFNIGFKKTIFTDY
jgi:hypothetical protein